MVTALFIKETLASAANDAEMVIEESRRMAVEYQERLEASEGGNGHQSKWFANASGSLCLTMIHHGK